jgi:hypothetical protein
MRFGEARIATLKLSNTGGKRARKFFVASDEPVRSSAG